MRRGRREQVRGSFLAEQIAAMARRDRSRVRWDDAARQELWPLRLRHAGLNLAERPCETAFFSGTAQCPISRQRECGVAMTMLDSYSHMEIVY
jgi:hypothetical protein